MGPVCLIIIDGLRPDAIRMDISPTLWHLSRSGVFSPRAISVMPSITLPCFYSIFFGVSSQRHLVLSNEDKTTKVNYPNLIKTLSEKGLKCGVFFDWKPLLRVVGNPEALDCCCFEDEGSSIDKISDADYRMLSSANNYMISERADFIFIYLGSIDGVGHKFGWMSEQYIKQVNLIDKNLNILLKNLPEEAVLFVHSDHGGHDFSHGSDKDEDMHIPWIVWNKKRNRGYDIDSQVSILDTAPTILSLMDIPVPNEWDGKVIKEVFKLN